MAKNPVSLFLWFDAPVVRNRVFTEKRRYHRQKRPKTRFLWFLYDRLVQTKMRVCTRRCCLLLPRTRESIKDVEDNTNNASLLHRTRKTPLGSSRRTSGLILNSSLPNIPSPFWGWFFCSMLTISLPWFHRKLQREAAGGARWVRRITRHSWALYLPETAPP